MSDGTRNIFVSGGLGFIGSHTVIVLLEHGYRVTIFDDLSNACEEVYDRMKYIAGDKADMMRYVKGDMKSMADLEKAFQGQSTSHLQSSLAEDGLQLGIVLNGYDLPRFSAALQPIKLPDKYDAVIHFAARKYVGESVTNPFLYYDNNIKGTINLIKTMSQHGCKNMVFSSSCTVYGEPKYVPLDEKHSREAVSPYGRTKLIIEDMFMDIAKADKEWRVVLLRYFNPVGAHASGIIGEEQKGVPSNLMPYVQQVVKGQRPYLSVYGNDYNTRDGTCIRDYVHVIDLAEGHVAAMKKLWNTPDIGCVPYNLGTGVGTTVLEIVKAFEKASGKEVPLKFVERRPGDTEAVWASTEYSEKELGWKASRNVEDMCRDLWRWVELNPQAYETPLDAVLAASKKA